jgi:tRNA(Ile)-lysidine synthase
LLGVPKPRLVATLRARDQRWVEDPSNTSERFARTQVRRVLAETDRAGILAVEAAAVAAARMAQARSALETWVTDLLAQSVRLNPAGFALADERMLLGAPDEIALRALARLLMCVGGSAYPPRWERLQRLLEALRAEGTTRGRTLAGCRITAWRGNLLVCREAPRVSAGAGPVLPLQGGGREEWDGRFKVHLAPRGGKFGKGLEVRGLGREGWRELAAAGAADSVRSMPAAARATLPALWRRDNLLSVPHLSYESPWFRRRSGVFRAVFAPKQPLTRNGDFGALSPPI